MKKLIIMLFVILLASCSYFEEPTDLDEEKTEALLQLLYEGYENFETKIDVSDLNIVNSDYNISIISELLTEKVISRYYYTDVFDTLNYNSYQYSDRIANIYLPYQYMQDNEIDIKKSLRVQKDTERQLDEIVSMLSDDMNDVEKVLFLHDYLISTTQYDQAPDHIAVQIDENFTIQGTLNEHKTMCTGYTLTLYRLLEKAGFRTEIVESDLMRHTWIVVEIDGSLYHIDPTWNDRNYLSYPDEDKSIDGIVLHDYFLVNDKKILEDHEIWEESHLVSTDDKYSEGYIFNNNNSRMNYYDGFWYYTENKNFDGYIDSKYIYFLYSYDTIIHKSKIDGSEHSEINLNADIHQLLGKENMLYYFNDNGVYSYNIDDQQNEKIYSISRNNKITEIGLIDETIKITYQDADYAFKYDYLKIE